MWNECSTPNNTRTATLLKIFIYIAAHLNTVVDGGGIVAASKFQFRFFFSQKKGAVKCSSVARTEFLFIISQLNPFTVKIPNCCTDALTHSLRTLTEYCNTLSAKKQYNHDAAILCVAGSAYSFECAFNPQTKSALIQSLMMVTRSRHIHAKFALRGYFFFFTNYKLYSGIIAELRTHNDSTEQIERDAPHADNQFVWNWNMYWFWFI